MKSFALALLLFALSVPAVTQHSANPSKPDALDGTWWATANADQRKGSIDGSLACLAERSQLPDSTSNGELMLAVDSYFSNPKNAKTAWVLEAFPGLPKSPINPHGSSAVSKSKGGTSAKASKPARQVPDFG